MTSPDIAPPGQRTTRRRSDLGTIKAWWRELEGDGFLVLPPPNRARYTQSEGHGDAAELIAAKGLSGPASFAYWHWQSHRHAFDRSGSLTGELLLHWGGDHATVAAGLGEGPTGFRVVDGGPESAFRLDRITPRDESGLPGPGDLDGVRQFLAALDEPVDRSAASLRYRPLSPAEAAWLHERLRDPLDLSAAKRFVVSLERRDELTADETDRLLTAWRLKREGPLTEWSAWREVLHALLRHGRAEAWELVADLGAGASGVLRQVPSERGLAAVREFALAGDRASVHSWLALHRSRGGAAAGRAAAAPPAGHTPTPAPPAPPPGGVVARAGGGPA
ncbi:hypothetical protein ACFXGX_15175, partial [Streptomyces sp. NPDC059371]